MFCYFRSFDREPVRLLEVISRSGGSGSMVRSIIITTTSREDYQMVVLGNTSQLANGVMERDHTPAM
jgi:hypothetical protein